MKPEQRSLLAIALSIGVLILWYFVFAPKPETRQEGPVTPAATETAAPAPSAAAVERLDDTAAADPTTASRPKGAEQTVTLETPLFAATFSTYGARLNSLVLKNYQAQVGGDSPLVNLVPEASDRALDLKCRNCSRALPRDAEYRIEQQSEHSVTFRWESPELTIVRRYQIDDQRYLIDQTITVLNRGEASFEGQMGMGWLTSSPPAPSGFLSGMQGSDHQVTAVFQLGSSLERISREKNDSEGLERGVITWSGLEDRYFLRAVISRKISDQDVVTYQYQGDRVASTLYYPPFTLRGGERTEFQYSIYAGPKEINDLDAVGVGLDASIDHGWFAILAVPILYCLKFFEGFLNSWGLAIIFLTIVVKLLMNPLTVKGMKSMKAMQKLQPQLKELREKYADDKARLNQETMAMFRAHKVNPMGGCLPMLLQMPIYIALYRVLFGSIELRHAPFLFYQDLAAPDPYYVTPVLLGVFMVLQQKMTPSASADPMQKKMMMIMPVMFTVFMVFLPMGLVLYILVNTVMTVVQHYMFNHDIRWRDIFRGRIKLR